MQIWEKFGKHLKDELDLVQFDKIYEDIYTEGKFNPDQLTRIVLLTLYYQEYLGKQDNIPQLATYLNLLKNEEAEEIPYDCLLYIIALCFKCHRTNKQNSLDNLMIYC